MFININDKRINIDQIKSYGKTRTVPYDGSYDIFIVYADDK